MRNRFGTQLKRILNGPLLKPGPVNTLLLKSIVRLRKVFFSWSRYLGWPVPGQHRCVSVTHYEMAETFDAMLYFPIVLG